MKGVSLPVETVVVLVLAVLVLVSVSWFFFTGSQKTSEVEARGYFLKTCPVIKCGAPDPFRTAAELETQNKKFYESCVALYPEAKNPPEGRGPIACIERCQCEVTVSPPQVQQNIQSFLDSVRSRIG